MNDPTFHIIDFDETSQNYILYDDYDFDGNNTAANSFVSKIGQNFQKLLYLSLHNSRLNSFDDVCELAPSLVFFDISATNIHNISNCIGDFKQLKYFVADHSPIEFISDKIFNLPKIETIELYGGNINFQTINENFNGYNQDSIKTVYFQLNDFCEDYWIVKNNETNTVSNSNDTWSYDSINWELMQFIDTFGACTDSCTSATFEFVCQSSKNGNGLCDDACNIEQCNWDNGDCHQTCDYTKCDAFTDWQNGICNPDCNSTLCNWDGNDCIDNNEISIDSCGTSFNNNNNSIVNITMYNYMYNSSHSYQYSTYCNATSMLGNGWCDKSCLNTSVIECNNYEKINDCQCDNDDYCNVIWFIFGLVDADRNELLNSTDLCSNPAYVPAINTYLSDNHQVTDCDNITGNPLYDANLDNYISFGELILLLINQDTQVSGAIVEPVPKLQMYQIDCSGCMTYPQRYWEYTE